MHLVISSVGVII